MTNQTTPRLDRLKATLNEARSVIEGLDRVLEAEDVPLEERVDDWRALVAKANAEYPAAEKAYTEARDAYEDAYFIETGRIAP